MNFLARNERRLIAAWLALGTCALLAFAVFGIALQGAESLVDRSQARWGQRLTRARELLAASRLEEAELWLAELDREHPARHVLYARDREREQILTLLGRTRLRLGKKRAALETLEQLVAFDPLNWKNHDELRRAQAELLEPELAAATAEQLLTLHGSHWPSVAMLVAQHADAGRFEQAVAVFERYLDVYRLAPLRLRFSGAGLEDLELTLEVPADGRPHELAGALAIQADWAGELELTTGGYSLAVSRITLEAARLAGRALTPRGAEARSYQDPQPLEQVVGGRLEGAILVADSLASSLVFALAAPPPGSDGVRLVVTVYKHTTAETWRRVEQALVNLVDPERAARLGRRVLVGGCLAGGTVFP